MEEAISFTDDTWYFAKSIVSKRKRRIHNDRIRMGVLIELCAGKYAALLLSIVPSGLPYPRYQHIIISWIFSATTFVSSVARHATYENQLSHRNEFMNQIPPKPDQITNELDFKDLGWISMGKAREGLLTFRPSCRRKHRLVLHLARLSVEK